MLTISGHSDDIVMIEGDMNEEFYIMDQNKWFLAFSDGTLLSVRYDGTWHLDVLTEGPSFAERIPCKPLENYSDKIIFNGNIHWCLLADEERVIMSWGKG